MRYPIVVADLDGTLFNQEHAMSRFTQETIQWLIAEGLHFIFATGRHAIDVQLIQKRVGVRCFMITANGARVHDDLGNVLFKQDISATVANSLLQLAPIEQGIVTSAYHDSGWFINSTIPGLERFHPDSSFQYDPFPTELQNLPRLCKVFYVGANEALMPLEGTIYADWNSQVNVTLSNKNCLEVMASTVSKGHALQRLLAHPLFASQGYTLKDCIAFGDGMNDLELLSMVGKGCMMANSVQRLKESLPELEIIGDHQEDAVAHYLRHKFFYSDIG
jgi:Cof subfamily protein (haloacid dehalogenase superfamily)